MEASQPQILAHVPKLQRFAQALTGNQHDGDALTAKTIECAISLLSFVPKNIAISTWLYSIMHNLTLEFFSDRYGEITSKTILPYINPSDLATGIEAVDKADVKGALAHLSLEQRETILLVSIERLHYQDVCHIMGFNNAKLIACLDEARIAMCEFLYHDQFEELQLSK